MLFEWIVGKGQESGKDVHNEKRTALHAYETFTTDQNDGNPFKYI